MTIYQCQWPTLGNMSIFIIDPASKKVYSEERPLPPHMLDLNIPENRYIKLSSVLKLFPSLMLLEVDEILKDLITNFKLEDKITLTFCNEKQRNVITYLPLTTFLAFLIIWPHCHSFQKLRNILLTYLDNFSDSVCIECGYIKQNCICEKLYANINRSMKEAMGYGVNVIDKSCQVNFLNSSNDNFPTESHLETSQLNSLNKTPEFNKTSQEQLTDSSNYKEMQVYKNTNNSFVPLLGEFVTTIDSRNKIGLQALQKSFNDKEKVNHIIFPFASNLQLPHNTYDISNDGLVLVDYKANEQDLSEQIIPKKKIYAKEIVKPSEILNQSKAKSNLVEYPIENEKEDEIMPKDEAKKNSKLWRLIEEETDNQNKISLNSANDAMIEEDQTTKGLEPLVNGSSDLVCNKMNTNAPENLNLEINLKESTGELFKDSNENIGKQSLNEKLIYRKFEYMPTGEHIYRCTIAKCGQCFDTKDAADLHCKVHGNSDDASQITCPDCDFKAPLFNWYNLVRHLRSAHEHRICCNFFSCKFCGLTFDNEDALINHLDFHYSNRYKCIYCGLLLLTWKQVEKHFETCSDKHRSNVSLGCPYCTFIFHKKNIRNIHLLSHSDVGLSCAICQDNKNWDDWKDLRKHYQSKHSKILSGRITPFRHDLPIKKKPPKCKLCDVDFKSFDLYVNHMTRAHDFVPYTLIECPQCDRKFRTEKSFEWHVKHVHIVELNCDKCSYTTSSQTLLKLHFTQKHNEKQHMCTQCDKSFAYFHQLKVHLAHHASRTSYTCEDCEQEFTRSSDLKQHQLTEHSEKEINNALSQDDNDETIKSVSEKKNNEPVEVHETRSRFRSTNRDYDQSISPPPAKVPKYNITDSNSSLLPLPTLIPERSTSPNFISRRNRKTKYDRELLEERIEEERRVAPYDKMLRRKRKEEEERLRKLHKITCARTRTYDEHRSERMRIDHTHDVIQHFSSSDEIPLPKSLPLVAKIEPAVALSLLTYPYLDHSYFKVELMPAGTVKKLEDGLSPPKLMSPSANSMHLNEARKRFSHILESVSTNSNHRSEIRSFNRLNAVDDYDLENLSSEITDLDVLAENELLKSTGGYNLIQDILSCAPVPRHDPVTNALDLDDIELCEDDYNLFHQSGRKSSSGGEGYRTLLDNHTHAGKSFVSPIKSPDTSGLLSLSEAALRLRCIDDKVKHEGQKNKNVDKNYQNNVDY